MANPQLFILPLGWWVNWAGTVANLRLMASTTDVSSMNIFFIILDLHIGNEFPGTIGRKGGCGALTKGPVEVGATWATMDVM